MQKKAKYMLKRPFRLREDGTGLRVTISHIRGASV
jgi:hypothetical protein